MISNERSKFLTSLKFPLLFFILITVIEIIQYTFNLDFTKFGILPRSTCGLIGIITAPLIHSGFNHLIANTFPLLVLGTATFYFYPESSKKMVIILYITTDLLVWLFARGSYHIGVSGVVYGLASFIFFSGVFRKDRRALTLSLLTIFLYSSLLVGIFPTEKGISWESHLFGFLTGIVLAIIFRKKDPFKKYDWEDEELEEDVRNLEINYKKGNPFEEEN